jgi:AcrR family transcriptional regulator
MDASVLRNNLRPRLRQDEKSAETRRRLLDAAILSLVERGYANTTGSDIAERAGLSRGAQLYHFPTKEELLSRAVEHLFDLMLNEIRDRLAKIPSNVMDRSAATIDCLWDTARGPLYQAWMELMTASRTDEYLRDPIRAVNRRLAEFIGESFGGLFESRARALTNPDVFPMLVLLIVEALAIGVEARDSHDTDRVLSALKDLCGSV